MSSAEDPANSSHSQTSVHPRPIHDPSAHPETNLRNEPRESPEAIQWPWIDVSATKFAQAIAFGLIFGFLLQKGGVAKFDILIGALLLENFVVVQVMLSAIIVGMIGVYLLRRKGVLETQINETMLGANIIGGLIFGVGFGLIAYCPGTDAAAVGQGNFDAIVGILGMLIGSYLYALGSRFTDRTVGQWGQLGKQTLADLVRQPTGIFIGMFIPWLIIVLLVLELITRGL